MCSEGSRSGFWPSRFSEAWGTTAKQPHIFWKIVALWLCRRRRHDQQTSMFLIRCDFLALAPQASKTPLGQQQHFGIPLVFSCLVAKVCPEPCRSAGFALKVPVPSKVSFGDLTYLHLRINIIMNPGNLIIHSKRRGASCPAFWNGFWGPRGRPDPKKLDDLWVPGEIGCHDYSTTKVGL